MGVDGQRVGDDRRPSRSCRRMRKSAFRCVGGPRGTMTAMIMGKDGKAMTDEKPGKRRISCGVFGQSMVDLNNGSWFVRRGGVVETKRGACR